MLRERIKIMKKLTAIAICLTVIITCLAACGTKTEGGEVVTDFGNNPVAVVTDANGGAQRDANGNLIVLVTDADGKNVKNENGEFATESVTLKHVVVIGDTVETQYYSIKIPNNWEYNVKSFVDLKFDNAKGDKISITARPGMSASQLRQDNTLLDAVDSINPDCKKVNSSVNIAGEDYPFVARYVENKETGDKSYLGFIFFEHGGNAFSCMVTGTRDITDDIDDVAAVLGTIQYK